MRKTSILEVSLQSNRGSWDFSPEGRQGSEDRGECFAPYYLWYKAKLLSRTKKSCHILPIVAWPWGGQSDLFRYYSSRDEVLLYESLLFEQEQQKTVKSLLYESFSTGGTPSTW